MIRIRDYLGLLWICALAVAACACAFGVGETWGYVRASERFAPEFSPRYGGPDAIEARLHSMEHAYLMGAIHQERGRYDQEAFIAGWRAFFNRQDSDPAR